VNAQRLLAIVCIATFWLTGRLFGEFYPFSPLGMFNAADSVASRLIVIDSSGTARDVVNYVAWTCEGPLVFKPPPGSCPSYPYAAFDEIVLDHIQSHPAGVEDAQTEPIELTRRVFAVPDPVGPVRVTDCPIMHCTARRREPSLWTPRL